MILDVIASRSYGRDKCVKTGGIAMTEIKPCPFCGEKAETFHIPDNDEQERLEHPKWDWKNPCKWIIGCWTDGCFGNINHVTMTFFNEKDAINTWNRRTE